MLMVVKISQEYRLLLRTNLGAQGETAYPPDCYAWYQSIASKFMVKAFGCEHRSKW